MLVGEGVIGRLDGAFADREAVETVILSDAERKRSRVRTTTDAGTDIGLLVGEFVEPLRAVAPLEAELRRPDPVERAVVEPRVVEVGVDVGEQVEVEGAALDEGVLPGRLPEVDAL